jgi:arylsulfatase A
MVGKIMDKLEELDLLDNTIVIFTGDNGTYFGITSQFQGRDYKGGKGSTTDNGTHVPFIVHWPGVVEPGTVSESLVDFSDIMPTLADVIGAEVPAAWEIDGVSFANELRGGEPSSRQYVYCYYSRNGARAQAVQFVRTAHHKLYADGKFFDTAADFTEQNPLDLKSLTAEQQADYGMLRAALDKHLEVTSEHDPIINERRKALAE